MFIAAAFTPRLAAQAEGRDHRDARKLECPAITMHSKSGSPARCSLMGNTWAPEHSSIQEARNHKKPNEKTFYTRYRITRFPNSQPPSGKLTPPGPVRDTKAIGRAELESQRDNAKIFVGRSFSSGISGMQRVRLQPLKYRFLQFSHRLGRTAIG